MTIALGILAFVLILTALILVHEAGHFAFAKLMGVRVDEFALGFPPRIKGWRRGQTVYSINAIPLGGFVRMFGENGRTEQPDSFGAKPSWQRLIILAAGPCMNVLLSLAIFFIAFALGTPRYLSVVTGVARNSPAAQIGLRSGDRIVAVNGRSVTYFDQVLTVVDRDAGHSIGLTVRRDNATFTRQVVPRLHPPPHAGRIGVSMQDSTTIRYGPLAALRMSIDSVGSMAGSVPALLHSVSQNQTKDIAGPIGIAHYTTDAVSAEPQVGPGGLILLMALLSASLGVLNLLPIPALDGGRILFVLISWVRRKNLNPEVEGLIHLVGMAGLLSLILFISYQDVARWVTGTS